jgi:ABC-type branched-subunit amino acid transport system ATPase component
MGEAQRPQGHLEVHDVTVSFGGLRALSELSIDIPPGQITGVIGPNGSGKTTLINVITGVQATDGGALHLDGQPIHGLSSRQRARAGIARTFQAGRLFESMSVLDNVMLGATRLYRTGLVSSVLRTPGARREWRRQREHAVSLLSFFGDRLVPRLHHKVGTLSYANRRRMEIARALMLRPRLLLLDEPTAGMNPHESWELAGLIPQLAASCNCSVLLVEHKMEVITALCARVHVLDHGVLLASGGPHEVSAHPAVEEAFLGVE